MKGLSVLDIYLWTEGLASNLILYVSHLVEKNKEEKEPLSFPEIKGIILGDPIISFSYQYSNFGSFALARGLVDQINLQKISSIETSFILSKHDNENIKNTHKSLYSIIKPFCPFDILTQCPKIYDNLDMDLLFLKYKQEIAFSNNFLVFLKKNLKISKYGDIAKTYLETYGLDPVSEDAASVFSEAINKRKFLVYQTQNNFVSNSISTMIFVDYIKWKYFTEFLASDSVLYEGRWKDGEVGRYTVKKFKNLWKVQIYGLGGDAMDREARFIGDNVFREFVQDSDYDFEGE